MPYLNLKDGSKLFYREENPEGEITLLFCHGSGGNSKHWLFQRDLPNNIRKLFVDLPGHGQSEGSPRNRVSDYREVIKVMADELQLAPFFMAGHSLGGAITLDYARCYPDELQGIILVSTGARLRVLPSILETFRQKEVFPDMPHFIYGSNADPALIEESWREIRETPPEVFYADFTACDYFDMMSDLPGISIPALVLVGDEDRLTPLKYSQYLAENLSQVQLYVIEGAGHMVMLEKPAEVNKHIDSWIQ